MTEVEDEDEVLSYSKRVLAPTAPSAADMRCLVGS